MINTSIAIQVLPQTASQSRAELLRIVDAVIAHIAASGLHYVVGPFETTVEGDFDSLMALVRRCHEICIEEGAVSVSAYIKTNFSPEQEILKIDEKIAKYRQA